MAPSWRVDIMPGQSHDAELAPVTFTAELPALLGLPTRDALRRALRRRSEGRLWLDTAAARSLGRLKTAGEAADLIRADNIRGTLLSSGAWCYCVLARIASALVARTCMRSSSLKRE